jgi:hypothetical protein
VLARFRYSDLKETAVVAADAALWKFNVGKEGRWSVCGLCRTGAIGATCGRKRLAWKE